jgi:Sulfotransferase domain
VASRTSTSSADLRSRSDAPRSSLPNLVVIGAQKCGTTSLHYYLDQHPEISMARAKEVNFFVARGTWAKGVDWYAAQFDPSAPVRGESSPAYTNYPVHEGVPARMHSLVPNAKLVFLVRDPIERIVSQYIHDYSAGKEDGPIEEVLADGISAHPYVMRSKYFFQLEQYLPYFSPEQILVLAQEDLLHDRAPTMRQVFEFLEVDNTFYHPKFEQMKHRTSNDRRRKTRLGSAVSLAARDLTARFHPPRWIAWKAERLLVFPLSRRIERPVVSSALRERLAAELAEDANRLRELTGKGFERWSL